MTILIGPPLLTQQPLLTNERAKRRSQSGNPHSTYSKSRSLPPSLLWLSRSGQEYQQLSVTAEEGERGREEGYKRQVLCSL